MWYRNRAWFTCSSKNEWSEYFSTLECCCSQQLVPLSPSEPSCPNYTLRLCHPGWVGSSKETLGLGAEHSSVGSFLVWCCQCWWLGIEKIRLPAVLQTNLFLESAVSESPHLVAKGSWLSWVVLGLGCWHWLSCLVYPTFSVSESWLLLEAETCWCFSSSFLGCVFPPWYYSIHLKKGVLKHCLKWQMWWETSDRTERKVLLCNLSSAFMKEHAGLAWLCWEYECQCILGCIHLWWIFSHKELPFSGGGKEAKFFLSRFLDLTLCI